MNKFSKILLYTLPAGLLAFVGCEGTRAGYASAPYKTVRGEGRFEVRDYPTLVMAETAMGASARDGNGGFRKLFGYISGRNAEKSKIAMTTPVFMSGPTGERTMAFVMPEEMVAGTAPEPSDAAVTVKESEAGRFAVLRFSGGRDASREARVLDELKAWTKAEGLAAKGDPVYGYFDPPWTPTFLRRNEVMLRVGATP